MGFSNDARRRWLGILFLAIAAGLLIWGQTVFEPYLKGLAFIAYYGICFLFTMLAVLTAMLDLWIIRTRTRMARRDLLRKTFGSSTNPPASQPRDEVSGDSLEES